MLFHSKSNIFPVTTPPTNPKQTDKYFFQVVAECHFFCSQLILIKKTLITQYCPLFKTPPHNTPYSQGSP